MKDYLSTATAHLLSIRSDAVTNVAGIANAARRVFNTVIIAPSFINSKAIPVTVCNSVGHEIIDMQMVSHNRWQYL